MSPFLMLLIAAFLILLNGFFVAAEFALVKVRSTRLKEMADRGNKSASLGLKLVHNLDAYLSATQLGITLASIALGWVGEPAVAVLLDPVFKSASVPERLAHGISIAISFAIVSMLHIVLGELAPKSLAILRADRVTLFIAYPLHIFFVIFRYPIAALNWMAASLLRPFGLSPAGEHEVAHSEDELRMLVSASGQSGVLNETEVEIAGRVLGFADKTVGDVLIPRVDLVALDQQKPLAENLAIAMSNPYSRYPLVDGDIDEPAGVVHVKDLLRLARNERSDIASVMRPAIYVPITKPLDAMLKDFQREKLHMALVLDEYGGTLGVVTLEDVLEQIVGEIADEHDNSAEIVAIDSQTWLLNGRVRLATINERFDTEFSTEENDTIGGWVTSSMNRTPRPGDQLKMGEAVVTIETVGRRRIRQVKLHVPPKPEPPAEDAESR